MKLLERHYTEAEWLQSRLLPQDKAVILDVQDTVEAIAQEPQDKSVLIAYKDLRITLLSQDLRVEREVAEALCCLELPEEVSK